MQKILVANRGEIALRVMRTVRRMGIKTVAVYSEADRQAPHVLFADEAVCLGPAPSAQSYLDANKIIRFALELGVDAIHPGYGFLSEHAGFAQKVEEAGMVFIGPDANAIRVMGSKLAAKSCVLQYQIPMVPGSDKAIDDIKAARRLAARIGYPVLIKASAGGGGKGMRIAEKESDLEEQIQRAMSEALSSFGDNSVFIEKYVRAPRHIEVQVLADNFGNTVHLFERECSIQRRHQKVVEEAPSSILTPELRSKMGAAAVMVAKSCNYRNAGTVEFLVDENLNFYFLEMNTRLQVEHPVTEMITGIDLVEQQIRIARGEKLSFTQDDLSINGHAFELRVNAEDTLNDFLPSTGVLTSYVLPQGEGIRVDDGYVQGMDIPMYYDPMIAKLIVHGRNRIEAIEKMKQAIRNYTIEGVATTLPFGSFVFEHEAFISGQFDTHFVQQYYSTDQLIAGQKQRAEWAAMVALKYWLQKQQDVKAVEPIPTNWTKRR
jgi:acetyl-CoA carboxylase, biotin carboxylase subunit